MFPTLVHTSRSVWNKRAHALQQLRCGPDTPHTTQVVHANGLTRRIRSEFLSMILVLVMRQTGVVQCARLHGCQCNRARAGTMDAAHLLHRPPTLLHP
jgi:hypothetical protein